MAFQTSPSQLPEASQGLQPGRTSAPSARPPLGTLVRIWRLAWARYCQAVPCLSHCDGCQNPTPQTDAIAPCRGALSRGAQDASHAGLAAKPVRPRLDEFLPGRCADRFRHLRRLLSRPSRLVGAQRRRDADGRRVGRRIEPDSGRSACRRGALEARADCNRHCDDRRGGVDPGNPAYIFAGDDRLGFTRQHRRHHYAGYRRHQPRPRRPPRYVAAHRPQLPLCRRRPCSDRSAHGFRRRLCYGRDFRRRRRAMHTCADRAQPDPAAGD